MSIGTISILEAIPEEPIDIEIDESAGQNFEETQKNFKEIGEETNTILEGTLQKIFGEIVEDNEQYTCVREIQEDEECRCNEEEISTQQKHEPDEEMLDYEPCKCLEDNRDKVTENICPDYESCTCLIPEEDKENVIEGSIQICPYQPEKSDKYKTTRFTIQSDTLELKPKKTKKKRERAKVEKPILIAEPGGIPPCLQFAGVEKVSKTLITETIGSSITQIVDWLRKNHSRDYTSELQESYGEHSARESPPRYPNLTPWPTIGEFSIEFGELKLKLFVNNWKLKVKEDWLYALDFILEQSDECSDFYLYEAKFSIPTKPYPIPQATASVYFTMEVSRVKPKHCYVEVTYMFEGNRLVHTPFIMPFHEQRLFDIIEAKILFFRSLTF